MSDRPIIGVDIDGPNVRIGKVQNDHIVAHNAFKLSSEDTQEKTLQEIINGIDSLFDGHILGIGIGVPGVVDVDSGVVYNVSRIKSWKNVQLKKILETHFKVSVYVNNDANCFAVGEKYFGKARNYANAVGVIIGEGFGAGVIIDNKVHSGSNCGVGEFGNISYKNHNYEYYCSTQFFPKENDKDFVEVLDLAIKDDSWAREVFNSYGRNLGDALQAIIYAIDPEIIVLGGQVSKAFAYFQNTLWDRLNTCSFTQSINRLVIDVSEQENIAILGAAALYYDAQESRNLEEAEVKRKQAENALQQSEKKYFRLFNHIADPIFIFDKETFQFLDCNESVERIYGFTKSELKNMTPLDLHPPEEIPKVQKRLKIKNKDIPFTYRHVRKDGREMDVEVLSDEIDYDGRPASLSIVRDISQRIKAEKQAERRAVQASLINEVGKRVSSKLKVDELLSEIVNSVQEAFEFFGVMLLLLDQRKKTLHLKAIAGGYAKIFPSELSIKLGEGMIGMAALKRETQYSNDVSRNPDYVRKADEITLSELSVPIISAKKVIGVLDIQSDRLNAFDKIDIAATETFTSQIATAIENARLYNKAQEEIHERKHAENELRKSRNSLRKAMKETDDIMRNVEEGLFLLNRKLEIGSQYSSAVEILFNSNNLAKINILKLLQGKIEENALLNVKEYLELMFDTSIDEENIYELNPLANIALYFRDSTQLITSTKFAAFKFKRVIVNDEVVGLIVTVNDISEQVQLAKRLEETQAQSKRQMEWLLNLLHVEPALIQEFIESSQNEINEINRTLKIGASKDRYHDILDKIYRSVHLVKGNASLLDLTLFANIAHQCEDQIKELKQSQQLSSKDFIALNMKISEMQSSIVEVKSLIEKISNIQDHFRPKRSYESEKLLKSLNNFIKNLSKDLNKRIKFIYKNFDGMSVPHKYRFLIKDLLVQFARNSVYHGIEDIDERTNLNKDKTATIELSSNLNNGYFEFIFKDDGRGLQLEKLKQKALDLGKWSKNEIDAWDERRLQELIFEPGISTKENADLVAGRGMGMNIIHDKICKYKGVININTTQGKYCEFIVKLPLNDKNSIGLN
jgi:glucokinase